MIKHKMMQIKNLQIQLDQNLIEREKANTLNQDLVVQIEGSQKKLFEVITAKNNF